jgi:type IV pilus assembly protein PilW
MNVNEHNPMRKNRGVGLIEVMISIVIAMLLVLVIYQVYEISESQKRTITAGSDAQQNASYGLYVLGRDLAMAGNGIASSAAALQACPFDAAAPDQSLAPIPVLITAGATAKDPDTVTVLYGGSSSLSTPVQFKGTASTAQPYLVPGPVGFSPNDVIVAVQNASCTLSTVNAGGVAIDGATGFATLTHTPVVGDIGATYSAVNASLVNLGQAASMGRIAYTVDTTGHALRTQNLLPANGPVNPVINDVVNLKAQYGLDTSVPPDGIIDAWQDATGAWTPESLAALAASDRLARVRQVLAVRIAIVTRSAQYEKDAVTTAALTMFDGAGAVSMGIAGDDQHYRYKVLETIVPLRNTLWNGS